MTQSHFVELKNIVKRFGTNTVIDTLSLSIPQGKMVSLLGPSGCGKTTVLRLVAGLEKPTEGKILLMVKMLLIAQSNNVIFVWCFSLTPCFLICP